MKTRRRLPDAHRRRPDIYERVLRRLRQFGMIDSDIARALGITSAAVVWYLGPSKIWNRQRRERLFRARVMARLASAPYRWTLREIGGVWDVSAPKVCMDIREVRFENAMAA